LIAFFSGAGFRLGMAPRPEGEEARYDFLYHATSPRPYPRINQGRENLSILEFLGIGCKDAREEMFLTDKERAWAGEQMAKLGFRERAIVLLPAARKKENIWPAERFAALGRKLSEAGPVLVLWGPEHTATGERILRDLEEHGAATVRGTSVRELAALLGQSKLVVCNDTGDLHIGAAVGAPMLGLFGPTDPKIYLPEGGNVQFVKGIGNTMEGLAVETVFEKAMQILEGK
jgi:ADP-heptose:LPS heptosyltransferase